MEVYCLPVHTAGECNGQSCAGLKRGPGASFWFVMWTQRSKDLNYPLLTSQAHQQWSIQGLKLVHIRDADARGYSFTCYTKALAPVGFSSKTRLLQGTRYW